MSRNHESKQQKARVACRDGREVGGVGQANTAVGVDLGALHPAGAAQLFAQDPHCAAGISETFGALAESQVHACLPGPACAPVVAALALLLLALALHSDLEHVAIHGHAHIAPACASWSAPQGSCQKKWCVASSRQLAGPDTYLSTPGQSAATAASALLQNAVQQTCNQAAWAKPELTHQGRRPRSGTPCRSL